MISVTTDPATAKNFAGPGGRVFSVAVYPSILVPHGIEGRDVTYFAAGEVLDPEDSRAIGFDSSEDAGLRSRPRLRRVLTMMVQPVPKFYGVLHWSDGSDLSLLDEKVHSGHADDADFAGALLAEPRTVACRDFTSADTVQVNPDPDPAASNPFAYAADEPLDLTASGHGCGWTNPAGLRDGGGAGGREGGEVVTCVLPFERLRAFGAPIEPCASCAWVTVRDCI